MKVTAVVVLFLAFFALVSAQYRTRSEYDLMIARNECASAHNVNDSYFAKFKRFEFPDDEVTRCYVQCILEKFDLFDTTDGFKKDHLVAQLEQGNNNKDEVKAHVEYCADQNEEQTDLCTWAFRGFRCLFLLTRPIIINSFKTN